MEVPVVIPSKIPERNSTVSGSFRWVTILDWPGFLLFNSSCIALKSITTPAGKPSMIPPIAMPWDSPKVVSFNKLPNELKDMNNF